MFLLFQSNCLLLIYLRLEAPRIQTCFIPLDLYASYDASPAESVKKGDMFTIIS